MKVKKIIVVGGGSSGWMTAAAICKCLPNIDLTVIESPDTPIVGVGESLLPQFNAYRELLGLKDEDFMKSTGATYKLAIRFEDFYKKGDGGWFYPFSVPNVSPYKNGRMTWHVKKMLQPETSNLNYYDSMYPLMALVNNNTFDDNKSNDIPNFNFNNDVSYHVDAVKFGLWLKDNFCKPKGVKHIKEHIDTVEKDDNGIVSLNKKHKADLFIDCTGFKSMLLGEHLNEPFEKYDDILYNDAAWATQIPYNDKEKELVPYTNCTALGYGWVWNIPVWERMGTGYVHCSKFISKEDALEEFKSYLISKGHKVDNLKFRYIPMRVGMHKRTFVKNVVAIGLSNSFVEPLESTGLLTTHDFIFMLLRVLTRDKKDITISQYDRDNFTSICKHIFRNAAEFVSLHYSLSHREDTPYWKSIMNHNWSKDLIDNKPTKTQGHQWASMRRYQQNYFDDIGGLQCLSVGMNYYQTDELAEIYYYQDKNILNKLKEEYISSIHLLDRDTQKYDRVAKTKQKYLDYLKEKIYDR